MREIDEKNLTITSDDDSTTSINMTYIKNAKTINPEDDKHRQKTNSIMTRVITAIVMTVFVLF